jgi:hypothetical protein
VEGGKKWVKGKVTGLAQAGLPEDPRERLALGKSAALEAVNRFSGRRVGAAVLKPLLGAIKLRYGFTRLNVLPGTGKWRVVGAINPEFDEESQVPTPEGTSSGSDGGGKPDRFIKARAAGRLALGRLRVHLSSSEVRTKLDGAKRADFEAEMRIIDPDAKQLETGTSAAETDPELSGLAADEWDAFRLRIEGLEARIRTAMETPSASTIPRPHLSYPKNMLPTGGAVPYVSPGPDEVVQAPEGRGYLDSQGRVWQVDRTKARTGRFFEWDVQTPDGGHINVGDDGTITH